MNFQYIIPKCIVVLLLEYKDDPIVGSYRVEEILRLLAWVHFTNCLRTLGDASVKLKYFT